MSKPTFINPRTDPTTEEKILQMIRSMDLFDKVEIKYSKQGELMWTLTRTNRGVYYVDLRSE